MLLLRFIICKFGIVVCEGLIGKGLLGMMVKVNGR